jgi:hypothetical protein
MAEELYNDSDVFKSGTVPIHVKAAFLALLMGGKFDVKKEPNKATRMYAHFGGPDGVLYGHMFSPNAPFSKGVIPQVFKSCATTAFSEKVNLMLNGSMSSRDVIETCFEEDSIRYSGMDVSNLIESRGQDLLELTGSLSEAAKILKENDIYNIPSDMMESFVNNVRDVFGKKKQTTRGQQVAAQA